MLAGSLSKYIPNSEAPGGLYFANISKSEHKNSLRILLEQPL